MADLRTSDRLDDLLRSCVQCGLCLPTCATWLATGNEVQSPRGQLILLREILAEGGSPPEDSTLAAFDQCIGCRACETACPSGVPFTLLEHGMGLAAAAGVPSPLAAVPGPVISRLDSVAWLRGLRVLGGVSRAVLGALAGSSWRARLDAAGPRLRRLGRLLGTLPVAPGPDAELVGKLDALMEGRSPGVRSDPPTTAGNIQPVRVAFFSGCANAGLLADSSRRLKDLLTRCGCRIETPPGQGCCGALAAHTGRLERRDHLEADNLDAFDPAGGGWIVVEAAGCGASLKEQFAGLGAEVLDATEALGRLAMPIGRSVPLKVVFHDPCHLRHGQGITAEPRQLLQGIPGLVLVEPREAEVCCGSGGAWGLRHPGQSELLGRRKAAHLAATGADLVVTTNPGCLGQIADGLALEAPDLPILPLTDLLWYASRPDSAIS